ncbi:hypothetical protein JHK85_050672 [Glycine max]|nr:hypothetical protein JHK85_050672 [Glycine max]
MLPVSSLSLSHHKTTTTIAEATCHCAFFKFSFNKPHHHRTPLLFPNHLPNASPPLLRTTTSLRRNAAADPPPGFSGVADVIVVGAGVAGSALAYTLAKVRPSDFGSSRHLTHLIACSNTQASVSFGSIIPCAFMVFAAIKIPFSLRITKPAPDNPLSVKIVASIEFESSMLWLLTCQNCIS